MSNQIAFRGLNSTLGATCGSNTNSCDHDSVNTLLPSTTKVVGATGHQFLTVHVWDSVGCETDNIARVYKTGECVFSEGKYYFSKTNMNVAKPEDGSAYWDGGYTLCQLLNPGAISAAIPAPVAVMHTDYNQGGSPQLSTPQVATQGILTSGPNHTYGGWTRTADKKGFVVPRTGLYTVDPRLQYNKAQADSNHNNKIKMGLTVNGVYGSAVLIGSADDFSAEDGATTSREKTKPREVFLNKGDVVGIKFEPIGNAAKAPLYVGGFVRLVYVSSISNKDVH